jgi:hypothetical protein
VLAHLFQTFCYNLEGAIASLGRLRKILTTVVIGKVRNVTTIDLTKIIGITGISYPADSADIGAAKNPWLCVANIPRLRLQSLLVD